MPHPTTDIPSRLTINRHVLHITPLPTPGSVQRWAITEQLGAITVGHAPLHFNGTIFSMDAAPGQLTDPDWKALLRRAFANS